MRALLKFLLLLLVAAGLVLGAGWFWTGRSPGPTIEIRQPGGFIGQTSTLEAMVEAPEGAFSRIDISIEQNGTSFPVFALDQQDEATVRQDTAERLFVMRPIGKQAIPELQAGPARIVVRAARPALFGLRQIESTETRDVRVRLEPPRVAVLSSFHFVNHGGSELVVYRATPEDVDSGVRVGDREYPGFPASGAGITGDPAMRVAFFALLYDQDLNTRIEVYARDPAGNQTATPLDYRVFPKPYRKSRIQIDDGFLNRVVPAIASNVPEEQIPTGDVLAGFLKVNGELRQKNNQFIRELAQQTSPEMRFRDAFQQLGNSQVEAGFADSRTYVYDGQEIDQQVHLGFDLAVTANVPIAAAQRGVVVHADYLGIYGNCVVIDHGLGVQSLYAHLSSMDVGMGDEVEKGQPIGRSGMTGLAGGDHLHFTMLVGGEQVTPIDWWSPQWMQDRVLRKIDAATAAAP
jgi:murein DD-endopeptidase MepM/ murein hydrolase activator NlpD